MPVGNGITVRIRDANGVLLDEAGPTNDEPRGFRYRLITAEPSSYFEVIITVEKRFQWKEMETLFFAIAYDEGADEHLGSTDFTMAWAIPANGDYLGEHIFTEASKCENARSALLKTTYSMPNAASASKFFVWVLKRNVNSTDTDSGEKHKAGQFPSPFKRRLGVPPWLHLGIRSSWPSLIESEEAAACRPGHPIPVRIQTAQHSTSDTDVATANRLFPLSPSQRSAESRSISTASSHSSRGTEMCASFTSGTLVWLPSCAMIIIKVLEH